METFTAFVKNSTAVDLLLLLLTILSMGVLFLLGLILLVATKRRRVMYFLLGLALIPVLLGLIATYLRNREIDQMLSMIVSGGGDPEIARREAMIHTYIGAVGTLITGLIAVAGIAIKRNQKT